MSENSMEPIKDVLIAYDDLLSKIAESSMDSLTKRVLIIRICSESIQKILELYVDDLS